MSTKIIPPIKRFSPQRRIRRCVEHYYWILVPLLLTTTAETTTTTTAAFQTDGSSVVCRSPNFRYCDRESLLVHPFGSNNRRIRQCRNQRRRSWYHSSIVFGSGSHNDNEPTNTMMEQPSLPQQRRHDPPPPPPPPPTIEFLTRLFQENDDSQSPVSINDVLTEHQIRYVSNLVEKRAEARQRGDYQTADVVRESIRDLSIRRTTVSGNDDDDDDDGDVVVVDDDEGSGTTTAHHHHHHPCTMVLPKGYEIKIRDVPRNQGGGSHWSLVRSSVWGDVLERTGNSDGNGVENGSDDEGVLQIAHAALGLAVSSSDRGVPIDRRLLDEMVLRAKKRLLQTRGKDLRGRKAADAAFWFAVAGVTDKANYSHHHQNTTTTNTTDDPSYSSSSSSFSLFEALTVLCTTELLRFGKRPTCRAKDVLHIVERIAAAGVMGTSMTRLQKVAAECIETKGNGDGGDVGVVERLRSNGVLDSLQKGTFGLHSERSLVSLWRFSTRQKKQKDFLRSAGRHWERNVGTVKEKDGNTSSGNNEGGHVEEGANRNINDWSTVFDNPSLPLVIDLGCGMGVSLLGLYLSNKNDDDDDDNNNNRDDDNKAVLNKDKDVLGIDWKQCNLLGVDLSALTINYASSVSSRWKLHNGEPKRLHFCVGSAEGVLEDVARSYPGPVGLVMVQFPTPFRLRNDGGNSQLPVDAENGFMVTEKLLKKVYTALRACHGKLLVQSNCEDVAVLVRNKAIEEVGFTGVEVVNHVQEGQWKTDELTKRTIEWIKMGGKRAEGKDWSVEPFLPSRGATETEVSCIFNGTPVHRCLLST